MRKTDDKLRKHVRDRYARVAKTGSSCCAPAPSPCGCGKKARAQDETGRKIGYSAEDLAAIPEDANLGLGCGNPPALAGLKPGEVVLDLGAGGGIDCFLAARRVGPAGRVIGVDMTPEMLDRARENARKSGLANVEFRLGEIEHLPVADGSVDVIISNCVINLSTDKAGVFREAFRVLRPGGRMMVSDLALKRPIPPALRDSAEAYVACIAGAMLKDDYLGLIRRAGFRRVTVVSEKAFPPELVIEESAARGVAKKLKMTLADLRKHLASVSSLSVRASKAEN
jgi:SAM-dependent methyltransferase